MDIERFRRWHWIVISIVLGALLSHTRLYNLDGSQTIPGENVTDRLSISPGDFVRKLPQKTSQDFPLISDVVIYPPVEQKVFVTAVELVPSATAGMGKHREVQLTTEVPFKLAGAPAPKDASYSIRDYVEEVAKTNEHVTYQFAWWVQPPAVWGLWGGGTVLVVGVIWPTLVNLMLGRGLLGGRRQEEEEYDLERFGKHKEPEPASAGKGVSEDDRRRLAEVQAAYEKSLAPTGEGHVAAGTSGTDVAAPLKPLAAGPLEVASVPKPDDEPKEYKGEFYPVARPGGAHKETQAH